jgi:hypothetical protein
MATAREQKQGVRYIRGVCFTLCMKHAGRIRLWISGQPIEIKAIKSRPLVDGVFGA